jgi:hypothetical protein
VKPSPNRQDRAAHRPPPAARSGRKSAGEATRRPPTAAQLENALVLAALDATDLARTRLDRLAALDQLRAELAAAELALLLDLRASGSPWSQIGDRLGITRSAAHQRLARLQPRSEGGCG